MGGDILITIERYEYIKARCEEKGYELLTKRDNIQNNMSEITYICPFHGEYTTKVTSIIQGKSCYKCSRQIALAKRWEHNKLERARKLFGLVTEKCLDNNYELLSDLSSINGYKSYIRYSCPIHGEKTTRVGNLLNGKKCPDCYHARNSERYRLDKDTIINKVEQCGGKILNPEEYVNNSTKNLKILCPSCGEEFITSLVLFTQHGGQCCDSCYRKESIGERRIRKCLENKSIIFEQEKIFDDCKDERHLVFDFFLPDRNVIIEFDGEQHFNDTHYFIYDIQKNRMHDKLKDEYCNKNGIKIIRIPYWNINKIEKILEEEIT